MLKSYLTKFAMKNVLVVVLSNMSVVNSTIPSFVRFCLPITIHLTVISFYNCLLKKSALAPGSNSPLVSSPFVLTGAVNILSSGASTSISVRVT